MVRAAPPPNRLDHWLVTHGHAATREQAQALIMAGVVTVDGRPADKPGRRVGREAYVAVRDTPPAYASRGGLKLAHGLAVFAVPVRGRTAVDLGASTGGFTDCLLRHGAAHVYAVDVGRGQLAWRLRTDPRVTVLEGQNARYLEPDHVGGARDLVTADLSFISLRLVWDTVRRLLRPDGDAVVLVKPQFEAGREQVRRGGVVRDPAAHAAALRAVLAAAEASGLAARAASPSPLQGPAGNIEYLVHLRRDGAAASPLDVAALVAEAQATFGRTLPAAPDRRSAR